VSTEDVSSRRIRIELAGGRFSGLFRPACMADMLRAAAIDDGAKQKEKLYDACLVEGDAKAPALAKRSFGIQLNRLAGEDLVAEEVSEDDLSDASAEAFVEKKAKLPNAEILCLRLGSDEFLMLAPKPSRLEQDAKKHSLATYDALIDDCCFHGREALDTLRREKPLGVAVLAVKLFEIGGLTLEAVVGEA
jgi:sarcosine oxidase gamma subunit